MWRIGYWYTLATGLIVAGIIFFVLQWLGILPNITGRFNTVGEEIEKAAALKK